MKAYKIIFTIVAMVMFAQMMAINAYAYIDVSATSYIIQIVAGIVVAVGAVIGVVNSRVKKKAKDKFGIDLDHKEHEDDVVVYDNSSDEKKDDITEQVK